MTDGPASLAEFIREQLASDGPGFVIEPYQQRALDAILRGDRVVIRTRPCRGERKFVLDTVARYKQIVEGDHA